MFLKSIILITDVDLLRLKYYHLVMEGYALLILAFLILFSKLITNFLNKINIPPVLGLILLGIVLGPTGLDVFHIEEDYQKLRFFADIGVVILLFIAGLETNFKRMKKFGKTTTIIAFTGIITPILLGFLISYIYYQNFTLSLLFGIITAATSVSISVKTLMDMDKFKTVESNIIMGSAIIDDIISILILTFYFGFIDHGQSSILSSFLEIIIFLISAILVGIFIIPRILKFARNLNAEFPLVSIALVILFLFAWTAEKANLAAISGAYFAGLFVGETNYKRKVLDGVSYIGHALFTSIFFIFIGVELNLRTANIAVGFTLLFILLAIISKLFGIGLSSKMVGFSWKRALRIGSGMIPRGEVALVIASIALTGEKSINFTQSHFSSVVFMVITTTMVTPFLLRLFFKENNKSGGS